VWSEGSWMSKIEGLSKGCVSGCRFLICYWEFSTCMLRIVTMGFNLFNLSSKWDKTISKPRWHCNKWTS
jgi:hypothetical protein